MVLQGMNTLLCISVGPGRRQDAGQKWAFGLCPFGYFSGCLGIQREQYVLEAMWPEEILAELGFAYGKSLALPWQLGNAGDGALPQARWFQVCVL